MYRHPLEPAIRALKLLQKKTGNAEAQSDLRFAVGVMEDHAEHDLQTTSMLLNLERKADATIEARDRLAAALGLEPGTPMVLVLKAAYEALETMTAALEAQQKEAAA